MHVEDDHQRARHLLPDGITKGPVDQTTILHGLALGVYDTNGPVGMVLTQHGRDVRAA